MAGARVYSIWGKSTSSSSRANWGEWSSGWTSWGELDDSLMCSGILAKNANYQLNTGLISITGKSERGMQVGG